MVIPGRFAQALAGDGPVHVQNAHQRRCADWARCSQVWRDGSGEVLTVVDLVLWDSGGVTALKSNCSFPHSTAFVVLFLYSTLFNFGILWLLCNSYVFYLHHGNFNQYEPGQA